MPFEEQNGIKKCLETLRECIDLMFWGVFIGECIDLM